MSKQFNPSCGRIRARLLRGYLAELAEQPRTVVASRAPRVRLIVSATGLPTRILLAKNDLLHSDFPILASSAIPYGIANATPATFSIDKIACAVLSQAATPREQSRGFHLALLNAFNPVHSMRKDKALSVSSSAIA